MSELRTNLLSNAAGTGPAGLFKQSAAKAWANLNGTGTIALVGGFNISSVVDNGTGDYTFNLTNAMASAAYGVNLTSQRPAAGGAGVASLYGNGGQTHTASAIQALTITLTATLEDARVLSLSAHGDLA
jgi:hypothetical protein